MRKHKLKNITLVVSSANSGFFLPESEPSITDLGLLTDIKHEWKKIGWALEVGRGVLGSCTQSNEEDGNKLATVLESWVDTMVTNVTWETVIAAVEGPIINHKSTALSIRDFLTKPDVHTKYLCKKDFSRI